MRGPLVGAAAIVALGVAVALVLRAPRVDPPSSPPSNERLSPPPSTRRSSAPTRRTSDPPIDARLAAATELKRRILEQVALNTPAGANESLKLFGELDRTYKDAEIRTAIGFDELKNTVVAARNAVFRAAIGPTVFATMDRLVATHVREAPADDTLAAAKRWTAGGLSGDLWRGVGEDLALKADEIEEYWKSRDRPTTRETTYGSGSFIVVRRSKATGTPAGAVRPTTDEEWWRDATYDKAAWLTAQFVECSGYFDVVSASEKPCPSCDGAGYMRDGALCTGCNGCGVVRVVAYR
jgi:hypothetical protein